MNANRIRVGRATGAIAVAIGVAFISTACGGRDMNPASTPTTADRAWTLQPGEAAECDTQAVRERIDRAWAQDVENNENGTLVTPPEMKDNGQSIAEIDEQIGIWRALSPKERVFELCKVARNRAQIESPSPTG